MYRVFFNPVKSKVFMWVTYFYPTRTKLVANFHLVREILCCIYCFCQIFLISYTQWMISQGLFREQDSIKALFRWVPEVAGGS